MKFEQIKIFQAIQQVSSARHYIQSIPFSAKEIWRRDLKQVLGLLAEVEVSGVWVVTLSVVGNNAAVESGLSGSNDTEWAWVILGAGVEVVESTLSLEDGVLAKALVSATLGELDVLEVLEVVRVARSAGVNWRGTKLALNVVNAKLLVAAFESLVVAFDVLGGNSQFGSLYMKG